MYALRSSENFFQSPSRPENSSGLFSMRVSTTPSILGKDRALAAASAARLVVAGVAPSGDPARAGEADRLAASEARRASLSAISSRRRWFSAWDSLIVVSSCSILAISSSILFSTLAPLVSAF